MAVNPKSALVPHKNTGQNRLSVHLLAEASGLTYGEMKGRLFHIALETPLSLSLTKDLIARIQDRTVPPIQTWRSNT